jgi:hypothetical protein
MKRKHISWKTRCAAAVLDAQLVRERFGLYPQHWYNNAKRMTEDQFLSLFNFDHNILHATEDENRDKFWNLTPLLIQVHRTKTKADAKIIAKSKRIRAELYPTHPAGDFGDVVTANVKRIRKLRKFRNRWPYCDLNEASLEAALVETRQWQKPKSKIRSRGFDKTLRKKLDGKVVKRER